MARIQHSDDLANSLRGAAHAVAAAGEYGDSELIHVQPNQISKIAKALGHEGSLNPLTGKLGFYDVGDSSGPSGGGTGGGTGGNEGKSDGSAGSDGGTGQGSGRNADGSDRDGGDSDNSGGTGGGGMAPGGKDEGQRAKDAGSLADGATTKDGNLPGGFGAGSSWDAKTTVDEGGIGGLSFSKTYDAYGNVTQNVGLGINAVGAAVGMVAGPVAGWAAGQLASALGIGNVNLGQVSFDAGPFSPNGGQTQQGHTGQDPNNPEHSDNHENDSGGGKGGSKDDSKGGTKKPTRPNNPAADQVSNFNWWAMPDFQLLNRNFGKQPVTRPASGVK